MLTACSCLTQHDDDCTDGGKDSKEDGGIFVVLHGIVRSSYVAPDGSENVRFTCALRPLTAAALSHRCLGKARASFGALDDTSRAVQHAVDSHVTYPSCPTLQSSRFSLILHLPCQEMAAAQEQGTLLAQPVTRVKPSMGSWQAGSALPKV